MLPLFEPSGLLPPGIHEATWIEVVQRLGWNPGRRQLLQGLREAMRSLKRAGCKRLWVDGSFSTSKDDPNDFDGCWDVVGVKAALLDPVFLDMSNGRVAQKLKYGGELIPDIFTEAASGRPFVDFFQIDKAGTAKGIVMVDLTTWNP